MLSGAKNKAFAREMPELSNAILFGGMFEVSSPFYFLAERQFESSMQLMLFAIWF